MRLFSLILCFIALLGATDVDISTMVKRLEKLLAEITSPVTVLLSKKGGTVSLPGPTIPITSPPIPPPSTIPIKTEQIIKPEETEFQMKNFRICSKDPIQGVPSETFYRIQNIKTNQHYTIKFLEKALYSEKEANNKLKEELKIIKKLENPFMIKFRAQTKFDNHSILIFDEFSGKTLLEFYKELDNLKEDDIKLLASELIIAFEYLRQSKISLGEMDLNKIIIDNTGHLKIIDFSLARSFESNISKSNLIQGDYRFMTLDMIRTKFKKNTEYLMEPLDWYSLGYFIYWTIFELTPFNFNIDQLTGKDSILPYENDSITAAKKILEEGTLCLSCRKTESLKCECDKCLKHNISNDISNLIENLLDPNTENRMKFVNTIKDNIFFGDKDETRNAWWPKVNEKRTSLSFIPEKSQEIETCAGDINLKKD